MGSDEAIDQAARTSYGKGTRKVSDTKQLLRYLMRHKHTTPFEMVEFKFHVKVPMDCWRQWIRHRTASVNEYSTRYSEAIDEMQETPPDKWRLQSKDNKQGSSGYVNHWKFSQPPKFDNLKDYGYPESFYNYNQIPYERTGGYSPGEFLSQEEKSLHDSAKNVYNQRLKFGVAKEQARKDLPLSNYTIAYWKIDLHNLLHFLKSRCDSHAQEEIRSYANTIAGIVEVVCPIAFKAWHDYIFNSSSLSYQDLLLLNSGLSGEELKNHALSVLDMKEREFNEYLNKIKPKSETNFKQYLKNYEKINLDEVARPA